MLTYFNFKLLFTCWFRTFFKSSGTVARLTWKRLKKIVFTNLVIYLPPFFPAMAGFALDNVFFPAHHSQKVEKPFFILGNFRSGSTLLQRLLACDKANFSAIKTWEFMYAPSITQRRFIRCIFACERYIGSPIRRFFEYIDYKFMEPVKIHGIGWKKPEEDESFNLYIFSTIFLYFVYPFRDLFESYFFFDERVDPKRKDAMLEFYRGCVKRHLYANRVGNQHFLSKNPAFTPKIEALHKAFPDARFIFLVRDPLENVPSAIKLFSYGYHIFNDPPEEYPEKEFFLQVFKHWYLHPLEVFQNIPPAQCMILKYNEMKHDLEGTVTKIYQHFGLELNEGFREIIRDTSLRTKNYTSTTTGELSRQGFTPAQLKEYYKEVYEKLGI